MGPAVGASDNSRTAFRHEYREATRSTTILAGVLLPVVTMAWSVIDRMLEPANADTFLTLRVGVAVGIALLLPLVVLRVVKGVAIEWVSFAMFLLVQLAVAWMLPRVVDSYEAYLLGFGLAIYASAIVVVWRWPFTALLAAVSIAALLLFEHVPSSEMTVRRAVLVGFYLGTVALTAVVAQYVRHQSRWREFTVREALEEEQRRSDVLLADLARLSQEDELTGVVNRRGWQETLDRAFALTRRRRGDLAVVLCDLDHFKRVNDAQGHAAGDEVLRRIARVLNGNVRSTDTVARLGGDEFAVIVPRADRDTAAAIAVRIVEGVRELALDDLGVPGITVSVGVARLLADDADTDALVHRADAQMYLAKSARDAACMAGERLDDAGGELTRTAS